MPSTSSALTLARTRLGRAGFGHPKDELATDVANLVRHNASGVFCTVQNEIVVVVNGNVTIRQLNPHAFSS